MIRDLFKISMVAFLIFFQNDLIAQSKEESQQKESAAKKQEKTESFGEFVEKVGKGIWNRFNERFNLENAGKSLVNKKDKILSPFQKNPQIPQNPNLDDEKKKADKKKPSP